MKVVASQNKSDFKALEEGNESNASSFPLEGFATPRWFGAWRGRLQGPVVTALGLATSGLEGPRHGQPLKFIQNWII